MFVHVLEQTAEEWDPPIRRVRPQDVSEPSGWVGRVLRSAVQGALHERRTRDPGLHQASVQKSLTHSGQDAVGDAAIRLRGSRPSLQKGADEIDDERRGRAGEAGPQQGPGSRAPPGPPRVQHPPGQRHRSRREEVVAAQEPVGASRGRPRPIWFGAALGESGQPSPWRPRASALERIPQPVPDALVLGGHRRAGPGCGWTPPRVVRGPGIIKALGAGVRRPAAAAVVLLGLLGGAPAKGGAQLPPNEDWRTLTTEHFRVTFPGRLEAFGRRAAHHAEVAYQRLATSFLDPPSGRIDVLVTDHTDTSNGFASVTPSNRVVVYAVPPAGDPNLGYFDDWLELVVTHEVAHVFHLDRTGAIGRLLRGLFGRVSAPWPFFPGTGMPRWTIEGLATWYESDLTDAGRVHGTFHEMVLRTAAIEGRFEDLAQAGGASAEWPSGTRPYAYGSLFFDHLHTAYGPDRLASFAETVAGQIVPYRLEAAGKKAFGVSLSEEWSTWAESVRGRSAALRAELEARGALTRAERLTDGGRIVFHPAVSPDGAALAYTRSDGRSDTQIRVAGLDGSRDRKLARVNGVADFSWLPGGRLLVAQREYSDSYHWNGDLYVVDGHGTARRITAGARLDQPSLLPDGSGAVAVQEGEGTNRLVRVDLSDGSVSPLVPFHPEVHWAHPAVSPDGRWIAVTRWTPGAMTDIVILDLAGRRRSSITHDRAMDLTPTWSPDGRCLLWASDRSGISNLLAVCLDPSTGVYGPVRQVTNVLTGALHPAISPGGEWIYFSGYHVDGWEIERIPYSPAEWKDAAEPHERFRASPRPARAPPAAEPGRPGGYSPFPTLMPRYWEPLYEEPVETRAILARDSTFFRGRRVFGHSVGVQTSGRDLVGRHAYESFVRVETAGGRTDWGLGYAYAGLGNPVVGLSLGQSWGQEGPARGLREEGAPFDTLFVLERERFASVSATFRRRRWRSVSSARLSAGLVWEDLVVLDNDLEESREYSFERPRSRLSDVTLGLSHSTVRSHALQLGASDGVAVSLRGRVRRHLGLPEDTPEEPVNDRSFEDAVLTARLYRSVGGPGFARHVAALRVAAGAARGPGANAGHFEVGGGGGSREPITGLALFGGRPLLFPVRGYRIARRFGSRAWAGAAEYRFPLRMVNRGVGPWPLHVDRVIGTVFFDAGNAWGPARDAFGFDNPRRSTLMSVGAEITTSTLTFWKVPIRWRTGVAFPLTVGGGAELYLRLGSTF